MKLHITLFFLLLSFLGYTQFDKKLETLHNYSDTIKDEQGSPIEGIEVVVVGGDSDVTNYNGEFTVKAKYGDQIILYKNRKRINSYTYNGALDYVVTDYSNDKILKSKYNRALDSAKFYIKTAPVKSIQFIEQALQETTNKKKSARAFEVLADAFFQLKQYDLSESNYLNAYAVYSKSIPLQLKLAKAYYKNNNFFKSKALFTKVLNNKKAIPIQKINTLEGLALIARSNDSEKASSYLKKALQIAETYKMTSKITSLNTKLAEVISLQGDKDTSDLYITNSMASAKKESKHKIIAQTNKVADYYSERNAINQEIEYRKQTLEELEREELSEMAVSEDFVISKPKLKYDIGKALVKQKKYKEAIGYFSESAHEAQSTKDIETEKNAVRGLSEVYVAIGDDKNAISNFNRLSKLVDFSFKNKELEIEQATALSKEIANKQNRILGLETNKALNASKYELTVANNKRQKLIIYSLVGGVLLLLLSLFYMIKSNKQRQISNNLLALKSLRSQMNPHFIFNALNSVNSFIASHDELAANRYLTDFSTLMRNVLDNSEQDFIPLEKEIELLNLYLKLEHARFINKFDYHFTISKAVSISEFQIPPMLLQPYVENAVWHGLRYKKEKGLLQIDISKKNTDTLEIIISDDGIGRKKSKELKSKNQLKRKSKGMQNIQQRIAILNKMYPNKIQVNVSDLFEDETGTKVTLLLQK